VHSCACAAAAGQGVAGFLGVGTAYYFIGFSALLGFLVLGTFIKETTAREKSFAS
jgi:hypothetical protein